MIGSAASLYLLGFAVLFVSFENGSSVYSSFFRYGDKNDDGKLDDKDEMLVLNGQWLEEFYKWKQALKKLTKDVIVKDGGSIKREDLENFFNPKGNIKIV